MPESTNTPAQPTDRRRRGDAPATPPTWASIATAAAYWDCSEDTIRRRISDKTLTARKFGPRLIRVKLEG